MVDMKACVEVTSDVFLMLFTAVYEVLKSWVKFFYTPRKDLTGEVVLLTGAAGHIGSLLAEKLVRKGCILVLYDIDEKNVHELANSLNSNNKKTVAYAFKCDITNHNEVESVSNHVINNIGHPTMLINNAGVVAGKYFTELTSADISRTFEVNVISHYTLVKTFLPHMLEQNHGHIVCVSSILALDSLSGVSDYGPSKAAASVFMRALRQEIRLLGKNIHCTSIFPYQIHTDMFKGCAARFSYVPFLNVLDPDYVTTKMVDAIQKNQIVLYIPRILYAAIAVMNVLPVCAYDALYDFLHTNTAMKTWVGKGKKEE
ncbi:short-chain dehydrogenase/reductase family 16C member 6-like [Hydractinia symbiolongicarpus]|uniref:short-chain dehydrogenase/reductase family 16C member 6-like n=1 Tax=Hydractinia symbiolongicarpus TaxID=13093 RepID=UPI0025505DB7|nr:short-chain dehydrogenase/reductase family 16C member 6-like [Hydractinia symbiolongicarpus]